MSIVYRMDGALLPFQSVRLQGNDGVNNGFPSIAYFGQPGIASVRIEDPTGVLDIDGWHTFTVEETACSKPRIFSGWLLGRTVSRGPYRHAAGRIWDCDIIDQNALFGFQVFRSSADSVRPAETDVVRVQAAIDSNAMVGTPIYDNGRFSTADPRGLGASNFVGQTPAENIGSAAGQSGKNFYAYWDDSARQISLHYDAVNTGPASTLTISNVSTDVTSDAGGTCYAPLYDATWTSDPTNEYTGVLEHWAGGYLYDQNETLVDDLSPTEFSPVRFMRDFVYNTDRISKATTAATFLQIELLRHSVEDINLTCSIQVVARDVNLARAGDIISVKFSHLPGYTTFTNVAIKSVLVEPVDGQDAIYNLHMELSNFGLTRGAGGGSPGVFPAPTCTPELVSEDHSDPVNGVSSVTLVNSGFDTEIDPTPGNIQVLWVAQREDVASVTPTGFTACGTGLIADPSGTKTLGCQFFYRLVPFGATANIPFTKTGGSYTCWVDVSEWSGVDTFAGLTLMTSDLDQSGSAEMNFGWVVTNTADLPVVNVMGVLPSLNVNDSWHPFWSLTGEHELSSSNVGDTGQSGNAPLSTVGYRAGPGPADTVESLMQVLNPASGASTCRGHAVLIVSFTGTCEDQPAEPGQPVNEDQPASVGGGQTTFTTGIPYAEDSLKVYVDGLRQPVIETDPATGTYTLLFDPRPSEYVIVDYQARTGG